MFSVNDTFTIVNIDIANKIYVVMVDDKLYTIPINSIKEKLTEFKIDYDYTLRFSLGIKFMKGDTVTLSDIKNNLYYIENVEGEIMPIANPNEYLLEYDSELAKNIRGGLEYFS